MNKRINHDNREISISELCWYIVGKWKWLIIGLVIGALILGAYGTYKNYSAAKAVKPPVVLTLDDLTSEEREEVEDLIEDYNFYLEEEEKLKTNYFMSLKYNAVDRYHIVYYIDNDYSYNYTDVQENYASDIVAAYKTYVLSSDIQLKIMELGIEGLVMDDIYNMITVSSSGNIVHFCVWAGKEDTIKIAEVIMTAIENYKEKLSDVIGTHELTKIDEYMDVVYGDTILVNQNKKKNYVASLETEILQKLSEFNERQKEAYNNSFKEQIDNNVDNKVKLTINKKYIAVGAAVGLIGIAFILVIAYIGSNKIKTINELKQVYAVDILGRILRSKNNFIKKKINQITEDKDEDSQKTYISELIINKCNQEGVNCFTICSTVKACDEYMEDIIKACKNVKINCKYAGDINGDTTALNSVVTDKNVILVEQLNVTNRNELENEIETCDNLSVNILGMIVII